MCRRIFRTSSSVFATCYAMLADLRGEIEIKIAPHSLVTFASYVSCMVEWLTKDWIVKTRISSIK